MDALRLEIYLGSLENIIFANNCPSAWLNIEKKRKKKRCFLAFSVRALIYFQRLIQILTIVRIIE